MKHDEVNVTVPTDAELSIFNDRVIEDLYGGDSFPGAKKVYRECAKRFNETLEGRLGKLVAAIEAGSYKDICYGAHQLKGSFNSMGSPLMGHCCELLESSANAGNQLSCQSQFEKIEVLLPEFVKRLDQFLTSM